MIGKVYKSILRHTDERKVIVCATDMTLSYMLPSISYESSIDVNSIFQTANQNRTHTHYKLSPRFKWCNTLLIIWFSTKKLLFMGIGHSKSKKKLKQSVIANSNASEFLNVKTDDVVISGWQLFYLFSIKIVPISMGPWIAFNNSNINCISIISCLSSWKSVFF